MRKDEICVEAVNVEKFFDKYNITIVVPVLVYCEYSDICPHLRSIKPSDINKTTSFSRCRNWNRYKREGVIGVESKIPRFNAKLMEASDDSN